MKRYITLVLASLSFVGGSFCYAQNGFKKLPSSLQYKIVKDVPGTYKTKLGDYMEFHLKSLVHFPKGDSILFDSRKMNGNKPLPYQVQPPQFKGDLAEGFLLLTEGDSAVFRVSVDSIMKTGNQATSWFQKGKNMFVEYGVTVTKVRSHEAMQKEQKVSASKQVDIDDQLLNSYFTQKGIKPMKTASGLYYTISQMGAGRKPIQGDNVCMNYTGMTLDGKKFDSNVDPQFNHVNSFCFKLGMGQVIQGWDEGVALLPKGSKGTLYIPSTMAYGAQSPSPLIPPNSVLVFDVEVVDVK